MSWRTSGAVASEAVSTADGDVVSTAGAAFGPASVYRYWVNPEQCAVYQQQCCDHHRYWNLQCCSVLHIHQSKMLFIH